MGVLQYFHFFEGWSPNLLGATHAPKVVKSFLHFPATSERPSGVLLCCLLLLSHPLSGAPKHPPNLTHPLDKDSNTRFSPTAESFGVSAPDRLRNGPGQP